LYIAWTELRTEGQLTEMTAIIGDWRGGGQECGRFFSFRSLYQGEKKLYGQLLIAILFLGP
jgi:hypothetical protein